MRERVGGWWAVAASAGLVLMGGYFLLPSGGVGQAVLGSGIGFGAALALAAGAHREVRAPWVLLAAGVACFAAGDALFAYYELTDQPVFPSAADGIYLAAYPLLFAGVLLLGRERGRLLRYALVDAVIAAAALALLQWVFVIEPLVGEESGLARVILLAYPAMDLLLAAGLARLLFTPAWRCAALWLLAAAILLQLAGDQIYLVTADSYVAGSSLDATWLLSYVLFAAAALHPSAAELGRPAVTTLALGRARVLLLGAALVSVPVALAVATLEGAELPILSALAAALSVLVLLRIVDLAGALAAENERLRELDRLKDEFVGLVSHDLRTPLTSIAGYTELLRDESESPLSEEQRRFVAVIERNARRLQRLLDDLLFEARLQAGREEFERSELDLAAVARQCVEESAPTAAGAGVELALNAPTSVQLVGDPARLAQLVDNLVSNAIKFTPAGGRVDLTLAPGDGTAALEVSDTGIGIPEGEEADLFARFFRASNARRDQVPGSGLGLHIAQTIAAAHGGRISVSRRPAGGTTVRVELPVSPPAGDSGSRSL